MQSLSPLVDGAAVADERIVTQVERRVTSAFARFDGWYSDALVGEVAAEAAAQVGAGQRNVAMLTDSYLAQVASRMSGRTVSPVGVAADMADSLRTGVAANEVYGRVAAEYRYQASLGQPVAVARDFAIGRALSMVASDLGLARQRQSQRFMVAKKVAGYRRVIRPEFSKGGSCGLCAAASDRIYHRGDLMPIHARCACTTAPIMRGQDPGSALNAETLRGLYEEAGGTGGGLKHVAVEVVQHGELGPQLRVAGQHFRGPAAVAA